MAIKEKVIKIALIGNPNSGKTSIFNLLTGLNQKVGNFPGITVEKKEGTTKLLNGQKASIIDFPGTYSLYPTSYDEKIVVQSFIDSSDSHFPDAVIYVADVRNLEKQLLLLTQIREFGIPTMLVLNMVDLAEREDLNINVSVLEKTLGIPVVLASGRTGKNISQIKEKLEKCIEFHPHTQSNQFFKFSDSDNLAIEELKSEYPNRSPFQLLLTAHHLDWLPNISDSKRITIQSKLEQVQFQSLQSQVREIMMRYDEFTPIVKKVVQKKNQSFTVSDRLDSIFMHRIAGPILFFLSMLLLFQAIFAWSAIPMDWIDSQFSALSRLVQNSFPESWVTDLITEGIIAGLGGILIFIPQIAILFFLVSLMEESGYMARVVFLFDRIMQRFGMNGRSVVALISGGACAIPAVMSARTISNWKERLITVLVTPLISCSARIPVFVIIVGLVIPKQRILGILNLQGIVFMGLYLLGIIAALFSGYIFKLILKSKERSFLMIELPEYKKPNLRSVLLTIKDKVWAFVWEAGKIILIISIVLWFLASYGPNNKMELAVEQAKVESEENGYSQEKEELLINANKLEASYAGHLGKFIEPAIKPLGFDWKIGIALVTSFAAREVFVGTIATLYSVGGGDEDLNKNTREKLAEEKDPITGKPVFNLAVGLSLLMFYLFAMQCMSTLAVVKKETGTWKWPVLQFLFMGILAYLASFAIYQFLS